jgi:hypothetical protein
MQKIARESNCGRNKEEEEENHEREMYPKAR